MKREIKIDINPDLPKGTDGRGTTYQYQIVANTGETLGLPLPTPEAAYSVCNDIVSNEEFLAELCPDSDLSLIHTLSVDAIAIPIDVPEEFIPNIFKIVTHDGKFHADEVLAASLLLAFSKDLHPGKEYTGASFARISHNLDGEKDQEAIAEADYVIDVGRAFDNVKHFDHHQMDASNTAAACKLVWDHIVEKLSLDLELFNKLDMFVNNVSLNDTGKVVSGSETIVGLVSAMNEKNIYSDEQTGAFMSALSIVYNYVKILKDKSEQLVNTRNLLSMMTPGKFGELILPNYLDGAGEVVTGARMPGVKRLVWLNNEKGIYYVKIPNKNNGTYDLVTPPFKQADYMLFVHANGFLATCKTISEVLRFLEDNKEEE